MLQSLVSGVLIRLRARVEETSGRLVRKVVLYLVAGLMALLAFIYLIIAFHAWLLERLEPPLAALVIAGVLIVLMVIPLIAAARPAGGSRRYPSQPAMTAQDASRTTQAAADSLAGNAMAAGERFGREVNAYKLVAAAVLAGIVLGRLRG